MSISEESKHQFALQHIFSGLPGLEVHLWEGSEVYEYTLAYNANRFVMFTPSTKHLLVYTYDATLTLKSIELSTLLKRVNEINEFLNYSFIELDTVNFTFKYRSSQICSGESYENTVKKLISAHDHDFSNVRKFISESGCNDQAFEKLLINVRKLESSRE